MRGRSFVLLLAIATASMAFFAGAYWGMRQISATHMAQSTDDLEWLRQEFGLGEAEMERIRQLHEAYLPICRDGCDRLEAKKRELKEALANSQNMTAAAEQKLREVCELRAQCQANMLRHFYEVSRVMPSAQAGRYLAEMQRLTLDFHERIEASMSGAEHSGHGDH